MSDACTQEKITKHSFSYRMTYIKGTDMLCAGPEASGADPKVIVHTKGQGGRIMHRNIQLVGSAARYLLLLLLSLLLVLLLLLLYYNIMHS